MPTNKIVKIANFLLVTAYLVVASTLDPFKENYSTLSLEVKGYLLFVALGILTGLLLGYETLRINGKNQAIIMFLALLIGTVVPHNISYNLQGNLHMFNAYGGFTIMMIINLSNLYKCYFLNYKKSKHLFLVLMFAFLIALYFYLDKMMVNTVSEVLIICATLYDNYQMYKLFTC